MKLLLWYFFYNFLSSRGEWIELPKVNPSSKEQKKIHNLPPPVITESRPSITLDMNMERILMEVHKTLAAEGRASINGKENFLKKLQSQLLSKIWGASSNIWSRTGVEGRGHGHVLAFPSLEGALMTIAFLTFAVFLIKIVKQCLQGIQAGNNVVGIELPGTMVTPAKVVKHKRSIDENNASTNFQCSRLSQLFPSKFCSPYE
ncbi:uncharacterized protein [Halyomorpha halys]